MKYTYSKRHLLWIARANKPIGFFRFTVSLLSLLFVIIAVDFIKCDAAVVCSIRKTKSNELNFIAST